MKKITLAIALSLVYCSITQAQMLTERVDDVAIYKMGNRPVQGTKALTFGLNINDVDGKLFSKYNLFQKGNLINGKYFISDLTAIRGGLRLSKLSAHSGGPIETAITGGSVVGNELKETTRSYAIMPGIEKHFSNENFFDVYTGADLYLGFDKYTKIENYDYTNDFYLHREGTTNTTKFGLGGVLGINMFVLDLPLSIGIEYGILGIWNLGGKAHLVEDVKDPLGERTNEYYTQDLDAFENPDANSYTKLKKGSSSIETNSNLRVLLNIYFK